jgi:hypothetical protein
MPNDFQDLLSSYGSAPKDEQRRAELIAVQMFIEDEDREVPITARTLLEYLDNSERLELMLCSRAVEREGPPLTLSYCWGLLNEVAMESRLLIATDKFFHEERVFEPLASS